MIRKLTLPAIALALLAGQSEAAPPKGYELVWQDEFDTLNLGSDGKRWRDHFQVWNVRYLDGNEDKGYKLSDQTFVDDQTTIADRLAAQGIWGEGPFLHKIEDGRLILQTFPNPAPEALDGLPYLASMISGQDLHHQRYGYWEIRFRATNLPSGHHMALWLLPDTFGWPPEMDLVEMVANEPGTFFANTHGIEAPEISSYRVDQPDRWHTIGFEWTEEQMIWRLNNQIVRQHEARIDPGIAFYVLASFEIGGKWPGPVSDNANWPGRFEIDYVRIYERR